MSSFNSFLAIRYYTASTILHIIVFVSRTKVQNYHFNPIKKDKNRFIVSCFFFCFLFSSNEYVFEKPNVNLKNIVKYIAVTNKIYIIYINHAMSRQVTHEIGYFLSELPINPLLNVDISNCS